MRRSLLLTIALAALAFPAGASAQALAPYQGFLLSTSTALGPTDAEWSFTAGDYDRNGSLDLVAIDRRDPTTGSTSVHVLDGSRSYRAALLQTGTPLQQTDASWDFALADYDADGVPDLWAILRAASGSGTTEVHVLSGASGFQTFIEHTATALHETPDGWSFGAGDVNRDGRADLVGVLRSGASGTAEVHALDGANRFNAFVTHAPTPLPPIDARWDVGVTDANGDGVADVFAVDRQDPASNRTAVHVLDGAQGFGAFLGETATVLGPTDATWSFVPADFSRDNAADLLAVNRAAQTSVAVLDGAQRPVPPPDPGPSRCGPTGGLALTARVARGTVGFGRKPRVTGRLTRTDGSPVAGTTVELSTDSGGWAPAGLAITGPDGSWRAELPAGATRRVYAAVSDGDTTPVCSTVLRQRVRAGAALKPSRRSLRNGQRVRFAGRLKGVGAAGRRVDVQGYQPGTKRWLTIATRTTKRGGRFTAAYRFRVTRRATTFRFRVLVRTQAGYRYVRGTSPTVRVRVRP